MGTRRILAAASHAELHEAAEEFLRQGDLVLIAPTRGAADDFLRARCGEGLLGVHAMTLNQIAAALAARELAALGLRPMSRLAQEALTARVVHALRRNRQLAYFEPVADTPGFVRALASTLNELRVENVRPPANGSGPLADLGRAAAAFAEQMTRDGLADLATILRMAVNVSEHPLLGLPLLLLDAAPVHQLQRELVAAVAERSPAVLAVVHRADRRGAASLEACLGCAAEEAPRRRAGATIERVREQLFEPEVRPAEGPRDGSVELFSAPAEGLECVEIARRIRQYATAGVAFDRMAILLRTPERYQPLVEEALRRAAIPACFLRGTARPDPAGRAFLALLACAAEGCSASRFAEYLSLGQTPELEADGRPVRREKAFVAGADEILLSFGSQAEPAPEAASPAEDASAPAMPAFWERLLVDAAVVGGRDRWVRRLAGLLRELELQLDELGAEEEAARAAAERRIGQLRLLQAFALPLIEALDELRQEAAWGEWIERLSRLAERSLRAPESVLAVLAELSPMAEVGPVGLDEVYTVLAERLRFLRNGPPARRYGHVFVCGIEEARGRHFEVAFVPGLAEGLFPKRALEDPLLLDVHRVSLAPHLIRNDDRVARERLLLHTAAGAADRLVVSYPRMDVTQGRPRVPSFYALEVPRAADGALPDLREFEKRLAGESPSRLGWPAPEHPLEAIDDAEYDLACLERFAVLPAEEARGIGRYLIEVSATLARSLRTRYKRWHPGGWSGADGLVDPDPAALDVIREHGLARRPYSPTSLERYARCPYRFLLHSVHRLAPREEVAPLEQMDPLTRGALFHEIQKQLQDEFGKRGLTPLTRDRLSEATGLGDAVVDRVAAEYAERLAPAIPRVWSAEVEELRTDVRAWLRHVAVADTDWIPVRAEMGFESRMVLDRVILRGSVDLVERHRTRGVLRVTDHKTGKPPDPVPAYVGGGASLQPLLYSAAVEMELGEPVERSRLFYCTHRGGYREVEVPVSATARQRIAQVLDLIAEALEQGFFPAAPAKDECSRCDYRAVCGPYEELRVARKPQRRLEPLAFLRSLP